MCYIWSIRSQIHEPTPCPFMGSGLGMRQRRQLVPTPLVWHKLLLRQLCIQTFSESDRCHFLYFRRECLATRTGLQVSGVPEVKCLDSGNHPSGVVFSTAAMPAGRKHCAWFREALMFSGYPLICPFTAARADSEATISLWVC